MKEQDGSLFHQTSAGDLEEKANKERLQRIQKLVSYLDREHNKPLSVSEMQSETLRDLSGGDLFDAIDIEITHNVPERRYHIVIQLLKDDALIPRVVTARVGNDGALSSLVETRVTHRNDERSSVSLEGIATPFEFADLEDESPERTAAVRRFNELLRLASDWSLQRD